MENFPSEVLQQIFANWITARRACLEESTARSLTVISLLFQSTTHCRYRAYTKFLLTYTAIYRRNRKVLPLGITALQPQSHFQLGIPYIYFSKLTQKTVIMCYNRPTYLCNILLWCKAEIWQICCNTSCLFIDTTPSRGRLNLF